MWFLVRACAGFEDAAPLGFILQFCSQLPFQDLAGGALGQRIHKFNPSGGFIFCNPASCKINDFFFGSSCTLLEDNICYGQFPLDTVRNPDHSRQGYCRMGIKDFLNLHRIYSHEYFPRIHQSFRVDKFLDLAHELITFTMFQLHEFAFPDADAMLTRAGAAKFKGFFND
jgi:hypothetical protein